MQGKRMKLFLYAGFLFTFIGAFHSDNWVKVGCYEYNNYMMPGNVYTYRTPLENCIKCPSQYVALSEEDNRCLCGNVLNLNISTDKNCSPCTALKDKWCGGGGASYQLYSRKGMLDWATVSSSTWKTLASPVIRSKLGYCGFHKTNPPVTLQATACRKDVFDENRECFCNSTTQDYATKAWHVSVSSVDQKHGMTTSKSNIPRFSIRADFKENTLDVILSEK